MQAKQLSRKYEKYTLILVVAPQSLFLYSICSVDFRQTWECKFHPGPMRHSEEMHRTELRHQPTTRGCCSTFVWQISIFFIGWALGAICRLSTRFHMIFIRPVVSLFTFVSVASVFHLNGSSSDQPFPFLVPQLEKAAVFQLTVETSSLDLCFVCCVQLLLHLTLRIQPYFCLIPMPLSPFQFF